MFCLRSIVPLVLLSLLQNIYCTEVVPLKHDFEHYVEINATLHKLLNLNQSALNTRIYSIGKTFENRDIYVFELTAARNLTGIPNIKLIGGMFGLRIKGMVVLLRFIEYLITSYGKNSAVNYLLENTRLHILPCMNPDGTADKLNSSRNVINVRLHTSFPDLHRENRTPRQNETTAIMNWMKSTPFVLSALLNEAPCRLVVYPYRTKKDFSNEDNSPSKTPDNDVFVYLSKLYVKYNPATGIDCNVTKKFEGVVNGGELYQSDGTMQDYNYFAHGCLELNLLISSIASLGELWEENKEALVQYSLQANRGVYGIVRDSSTLNSIEAKYKIVGRDMEFRTNKKGEFWKILLNGTYDIEVSANGYYKNIRRVEIIQREGFPKLQFLEIFLTNASIVTTTNKALETEISTEDRQSITDLQEIEPILGLSTSSASNKLTFPFLLLLCICYSSHFKIENIG